jgi:hypothetical protein
MESGQRGRQVNRLSAALRPRGPSIPLRARTPALWLRRGAKPPVPLDISISLCH